MELLNQSISEVARLLKAKDISPVELTTLTLERIHRLNPELNAFITITGEGALSQARIAEEEIQRGEWRGPLHGVPIGLKDLIDTAGIKTTCGSALFADRVPTEDAFIVQRLKQAGAVIVGKQNMQEFAWGGTSASSHFGPVRNPWDPSRIAGGSSGGSAAAVAAQMCFAAIGSDTGGSVREPASFCGVVGLKPTYGRVSTRGVFPLSWSLDHVGPFGRSVKDVAIMMDLIAGYDERDPYCVDWPVEKYAESLGKAEVRVGIARSPYFEDLDPDISVPMDQALRVVAGLAVSVIDVELPPVPTAVQPAEVLAIHARDFFNTPELYRPFMRERFKQAKETQLLDYVQDLHRLKVLRHSIDSVFSEVDFVVTPTVPVEPILLEDAVNMSPPPPGELWLRNTRPFNAYGLPTISVPCGFTSNGLPVGLQIAAPMFAEPKLLSFAHAFEESLRLCG